MTSKATKTATKSAAKTTQKTAAQSTPASQTKVGKPGSSPAKDAAADASAKSSDYNAKADAVKAAKDAKAGNDPVARFVVAEGKTVRSKGVRFFGGEAIDLPKSDGQRLKDQGVLIDDDKGETAKNSGDAPSKDPELDGQVPMAAGDKAPVIDAENASTVTVSGGEPTGDNVGDTTGSDTAGNAQ